MQTGNEQLKAQQQIMAALGFYHGKIDGVWGPASIAAKRKWESSGKFNPAIPNNGFPLSDRGPFPVGVTRQANGTLTCTAVQAQAAKPAQQTSQPQKPVAPAAELEAEIPVPPQTNIVVKEKHKDGGNKHHQ